MNGWTIVKRKKKDVSLRRGNSFIDLMFDKDIEQLPVPIHETKDIYDMAKSQQVYPRFIVLRFFGKKVDFLINPPFGNYPDARQPFMLSLIDGERRNFTLNSHLFIKKKHADFSIFIGKITFDTKDYFKISEMKSFRKGYFCFENEKKDRRFVDLLNSNLDRETLSMNADKTFDQLMACRGILNCRDYSKNNISINGWKLDEAYMDSYEEFVQLRLTKGETALLAEIDRPTGSEDHISILENPDRLEEEIGYWLDSLVIRAHLFFNRTDENGLISEVTLSASNAKNLIDCIVFDEKTCCDTNATVTLVNRVFDGQCILEKTGAGGFRFEASNDLGQAIQQCIDLDDWAFDWKLFDSLMEII